MVNKKAKGLTASKLKTTLGALSLVIASTGANAAIVTLSGSTVDFTFDTAFISPLFGSFSVSGDTLSFSPTTFIAEQGSKGFDVTSATTPLITVTAKSGYWLNGLQLFEQGDYFRIEESSNGTAVSVGGQFIINDNPTSISGGPLNVAISVDDFFNDPSSFETTTWNAVSYANIGWVESATVKVQNILIAAVKNDELNYAFIEKKLMNISGFTTPVPVPSAIWLFGSALTGIVVSRRKKSL